MNNSPAQIVENSPPSLKKLPAVKLKFDHSISKTFSNLAKFSQEIFEHKKINKDLIKFISLKDDTLIIATDDNDTHAELSSPWPLQAFEGKMILLHNKSKQTEKILNTNENRKQKKTINPLTLNLIGIHEEIETTDEHLLVLLEEY